MSPDLESARGGHEVAKLGDVLDGELVPSVTWTSLALALAGVAAVHDHHVGPRAGALAQRARLVGQCRLLGVVRLRILRSAAGIELGSEDRCEAGCRGGGQ